MTVVLATSEILSEWFDRFPELVLLLLECRTSLRTIIDLEHELRAYVNLDESTAALIDHRLTELRESTVALIIIGQSIEGRDNLLHKHEQGKTQRGTTSERQTR
jgi:hypothetical protein